ncbi:hypothetical protein D3C78_1538670 [compost metagenome]
MAGILNQATSTPLKKPASKPSSSVTVKATGKLYPALSVIPSSTAHIPVMEPTETSILRVSMTSAAPMASNIRICELLKIMVSVWKLK